MSSGGLQENIYVSGGWKGEEKHRQLPRVIALVMDPAGCTLPTCSLSFLVNSSLADLHVGVSPATVSGFH